MRALIVTVILVLAPRGGSACSSISYPVGTTPPPPPTATEKLAESDLVFVGTVGDLWRLDASGRRIALDAPMQTSVSFDTSTQTMTIESEGAYNRRREADVRVRAAWKGVDHDQWVLRWEESECSGTSLVAGETYLFFIHVSRYDGRHIIREQPIGTSSSDLKELGLAQFLVKAFE